MATGDIITATRYNQIQSTVRSVLGVGAGDAGYGIATASSQISPAVTVTADHMNKLRSDMLAVYMHQNGSNVGFSLPTLDSTDLISDAPSATGKNEYQSYTDLSNILITNRNNYTAQSLTTNFTTEFNKTTSTRSTSWGGSTQAQSVFHEFSVRFVSADSRRHFFNTGSEIRIEAGLTNFPGGGGQDKFNNWSSMFAGIGTVKFNSFTTTANSGTTQPIGNFDLTADYQVILIKSGSLTYADNTYVIKAREINASTITFLVEFNDNDIGSNQGGLYGPVDDPVEGTLVSRVHQFRATGTSIGNVTKVIVPSPAFTNLKEVSFFSTPTIT